MVASASSTQSSKVPSSSVSPNDILQNDKSTAATTPMQTTIKYVPTTTPQLTTIRVTRPPTMRVTQPTTSMRITQPPTTVTQPPTTIKMEPSTETPTQIPTRQPTTMAPTTYRFTQRPTTVRITQKPSLRYNTRPTTEPSTTFRTTTIPPTRRVTILPPTQPSFTASTSSPTKITVNLPVYSEAPVNLFSPTTERVISSTLKQLTEEQKKNLETLAALEKEQAAILKQLSFLTNLVRNLNGRSRSVH